MTQYVIDEKTTGYHQKPLGEMQWKYHMFTKKLSKKSWNFLSNLMLFHMQKKSQVVAGAEYRLLHSNEHDDKQLFIRVFSMSEKSGALKSTF